MLNPENSTRKKANSYAKKPPELVRNKVINLRLTQAEYEEIKAKCGDNLAEFIRKNLLEAPPEKVVKKKLYYPKIDPDFTFEINRIGKNFYRLLRLLEIDKRYKTDPKTLEILLELDSTKRELKRLNSLVENWSKPHDS